MEAIAPSSAPPALPEAFGQRPRADGIRPTGATLRLVQDQVRALVMAAPAYCQLPPGVRENLTEGLVRVASYLAELVRDVWYQSQRLDQRPLVRTTEVVQAPVARVQSAGQSFEPAAANQIARVTQQTLRAIAFPTFVADLIRGTFSAITNSSIEQMDAYVKLIENVSKTVDEFMADNISDNQARDWLRERYPEHLEIREGRVTPREDAEERPAPSWRRDLNLSADVGLDEDSIEDQLVPAARRRLAESRLRMLSTLVMMGTQRIVVTGGKIRATMGFHIDTTDRTHEEHATDLDFRHAASGRFGFGPWSASASLSFAYVRSTRADSDAELNVDADLTGEVDLRFKTDYIPLQRFANSGTIDTIRSNTAVPEQNAPSTSAIAPTPGSGGEVGRYTSPRTRRRERTRTLPPLNEPATEREPRLPTTPTPVERLHEEVPPAELEERRRREAAGGGEESATPPPSAPETEEGEGTPATGGPETEETEGTPAAGGGTGSTTPPTSAPETEVEEEEEEGAAASRPETEEAEGTAAPGGDQPATAPAQTTGLETPW